MSTTLSVLNEALAIEIVCGLRYRNHYFMARGIHAQSIVQEFLEHANEEQGHAYSIARTSSRSKKSTPTISPTSSPDSGRQGPMA